MPRRTSRTPREPTPYKDRGRWYVQGSFGWVDLPDGRRKRDRRAFSGATPSEALDAYRQARSDHDRLCQRAGTSSPSSWSVLTWLEHWLEVEAPKGKHGRPLSANTLDTYRYGIRHLAATSIAGTPVRDLAPLQVSAALQQIARDRKSNLVANRALTVLSSALSTLVTWSEIPSNPAMAISPLPEPEPSIVRYPDESVRRLVEFAQSLTGTDLAGAGGVVAVIARTGLRLGEALAVRRSTLDLPGRLLHVSHQLTDHGDLVRLKSRHSDRVVPLAVDVVALLSDLDRTVAPDLDLLLRRPDGHPWTRRTIRSVWREQFVPAAGLPSNATLKGLRSTVASSLADRDVPIVKVQRLLGHSSISVTERYYTRIGVDHSVVDVLAA